MAQTTSINVNFNGRDQVSQTIDKIIQGLNSLAELADKVTASYTKFIDVVAEKTATATTEINKMNASIKEMGGASAFSKIVSGANAYASAAKSASSSTGQVVSSVNTATASFQRLENEIVKVTTNWTHYSEQVANANRGNNALQAFKPQASSIVPVEDSNNVVTVTARLLGASGQTSGNTFAKNFGTGVVSVLGSLQSGIQNSVNGLFTPNTGLISNAVQGIGPVFANVGKQLFENLNPVGLVRNVGSTIGSIIGVWQNGINSITAGANSNNIIVSSLSNAYAGLQNVLKNTLDTLGNFGSAIRQVGQGLQSVGVILSTVISIPVGLWLKSIFTDAIAFQDVLVKVGRDSSLTGAQLTQLGENVRQLSTTIPLTAEELLKLGDVYGKIGVDSVDAQTKAIESTAKLAVASHESADSISETYAKLGVIYYKNADDFVAAQDKIGSALVDLSRKNSITTSEILHASLNYAPIAEQLKIPIEEMLALSATVASRAASAARAGTQIGAGLSAMVKTKDIEKLAYALSTTTQNIQSMERTNPASFFENMASSIGQIEDPIKRLQAAQALFGGAGSKAIEAMAANLPDLAANVELANQSFDKGVSIQNEYSRAMNSVQNQLSLLKNNVAYLGTTFSDAVLPYVTKFVALIIPALQLVSEYFRGLNESTKISVVGFALLAAAIGPVVIGLGSFLFAIGIITTGIGELITAFGGLIGGVIAFSAGLVTLLSPIAVAGAVIGTIALAAYQVRADLGDAATVVQDYIGQAYNWGYNLITSFGDGITSAASYVYNSVVDVIDSFIGLIQAFSPPREGPLTAISTWGEKLFTAYSDGFSHADFSGITQKAGDVLGAVQNIINGLNDTNLGVFQDTLGSIKSVISAVGANLGESQEQVQKWLAIGTKTVGDFITNIQNGASGSLDPINQMLGGLGDNFKNLITLQAQYSAQADRLHEIENALKNINTETDKQILSITKQTGLTAEQQAAQIRQARAAASAKTDNLNAEKNALTTSSDDLKQQADRQKKTIDILQGLIFPEIKQQKQTKDKVAKPKKEKTTKAPDVPKFDFAPLEKGSNVVDGLKKKFDITSDSTDNFITKLSHAKNIVDGFIAGITGQDGIDWTKKPYDFWKGFESGDQIRSKVLEFLGKVTTYEDKFRNIGTSLHEGFKTFQDGAKDGFYGLTTHNDKLSTLQKILYDVGFYAGKALEGINSFLTGLGTSIGNVTSKFDKFSSNDVFTKLKNTWDAFVKGFTSTGANSDSFAKIGQSLESLTFNILLLTIAIGNFIYTHLEDFGKAAGTIAGQVVILTEKIADLSAILADLAAAYSGVDNTKQLQTDLDHLGTGFGNVADAIEKTVKAWKAFLDFAKDHIHLAPELFSGSTESKADEKHLEDQYNNARKHIQEYIKSHPLSIGTDFLKLLYGDDNNSGGFGGDGKVASQSIASRLASAFKSALIALGGDETIKKSGNQVGKDVNEYVLEGTEIGAIDKKTLERTQAAIIGTWNTVVEKAIKPLGIIGGKIATYIIDGITQWWDDIKHVGDALLTLLSSTGTWIAVNVQRFIDTGVTIATHVINGIRDYFAAGAEYVGEIPKAIGKWLQDNAQKLIDKGVEAGQKIVEGIIQAIQDKAGAIWDAVKRAIGFGIGGGSGTTGKAAGGYVAAGTPTLVGEEGRELVTFASGAYVTPHRQTEELFKPKQSQQQVPNNNITINIALNGNTDNNTAKKIADEVQRQLTQTLRRSSVAYG